MTGAAPVKRHKQWIDPGSKCRPETLVRFQPQRRQTSEFMYRHEHAARVRHGVKQPIKIFAAAFEFVSFLKKTHMLMRGKTVTRLAIALIVFDQ
jgi:hypothetical protein